MYILSNIAKKAKELFFSSEQYWEKRYKKGGNSGAGSYGRLAEFKARVINDIIEKNEIKSIVEYGCGDGNQISLLKIGEYIGVDVSDTALGLCRRRFASDYTKQFFNLDDVTKLQADAALSIDVIFHLVEDKVFAKHMSRLFESAREMVIIYSSNYDKANNAQHVRHREFTKFIEEKYNEWKLVKIIKNLYQYEENNEDTSFCDFYVYRRIICE